MSEPLALYLFGLAVLIFVGAGIMAYILHDIRKRK